jgi:ABC-type bacteriocin/lantibiotic exporter with double-glycine peptidase domain
LTFFVRLLGIVRPYWPGMARSLGLGLAVGVLGLIPPYFSKLYFDNVYPARDFSLLHTLVIGVAVFGITSSVIGAIRGYYSSVVTTRLSSAVSLMYFNHLQHLPIRFFDQHRVGEIMSRLGDMRASLGVVSRVFQTLLVNGVYLVIVPPFLFALNWHLSILALATIPISVGITTATSRITRRYMKRTSEANAEQSAIQVEAFSQIRTVKTMGLERQLFRDAARQAEDALQLQLTTSALSAGIGVVNALIRALGTGAFTWYAWTLILRNELSIGSFIAFSAYLGFLVGPAGQVAGLFADFQQSSVSLGRAFEYLDLEPEQDPERTYEPATPVAREISGAIRLSRVTFGYAPDQLVLHDLSLDFEPGTISAIVGPSGTGKSTLLRLLCRIDRPLTGQITVDGTSIDAIPLADLRRQIGVVWQEPALLRGTIWDNLTIGLENPDPEQIRDVVRLCRLDGLIESLPDGYDTIVSEWGASLSGGQRQRFTLARALARNAPVLLLDEATSQVDVQTEEEILRELFVHVRGRTVILVTHRLATAALADRIYVLASGRIAAAGTHDELMHGSPEYRQMLQALTTGDETRRLRKVGVT